MTTEEVAGRALERPPAVMFPENLSEPEAHAVNVPRTTAQTFTSRTFRARRLVLDTALVAAILAVVVLAMVGGGWLAAHATMISATLGFAGVLMLFAVLLWEAWR